MWAGIAALRVGAPLYDVGAAVEDVVVAAGQARDTDYGIVEDYVGHGIGTEMHEDPPGPELPGARPRARRSRPGLCVAIEPMVTARQRRDPDRWTTTGPS